MEELVIGDKRYIPAKLAAREFRYAPDYIGQLIRSGKIVGQKMGRSWYVEIDSLKAYLKLPPEEESPAAPAPIVPIPSVAPAPAPAARPVKPLHVAAASRQTSALREYPLLTYLNDEEPILPTLRREAEEVEAVAAEEHPIILRKVEEVSEDGLHEPAVSEVKSIHEPRARLLLPAVAGAGLSFILAVGLLTAATAVLTQDIVVDTEAGTAAVSFSTDLPAAESVASVFSAWRESISE